MAAARHRLLVLVDPALAVLARSVRIRKGKAAKYWEPTSDEIRSARDVLNRAGLVAVAPLDPKRSPDESLGQVLWEEFIQIHRRVVHQGVTQQGECAPATQA